MKKIVDTLAYASILLNGFYLALWICVFNNYGTQELRVERFNSFLPLLEPFTTILLISLSILSLIILARKRPLFPKMLAAVQALFVFMYIWQYL